MKSLLVIVLLGCAFQASNALNCVTCSRVGATTDIPNMDCADKDKLPEAKACTDGNDICVYTHMVPLKNATTSESWHRACAKSTNYNDKKNTCQSATMYGDKTTTCVCNKVKDPLTKACNGSSALNVSVLVLAAAAVFRYLF